MFRVFEDFKTVWALMGTLLAGEGAVGVTRPQRITTATPPFYRTWTGAGVAPTDEIVKSGPGILRAVSLIHDCNHATTVGRQNVTIFDNVAASGNVLWVGQIVSNGAGVALVVEAGREFVELEFALGVFVDYGPWVGTQPTAGNIYLNIKVE